MAKKKTRLSDATKTKTTELKLIEQGLNEVQDEPDVRINVNIDRDLHRGFKVRAAMDGLKHQYILQACVDLYTNDDDGHTMLMRRAIELQRQA